MASKLTTYVLNLGVVLAAVAAIAAVSMKIRETVIAKREAIAAEPKAVSDWRRYTLSGQRMGPASAPVTIVVYSDFQCPYCRAFAADLRSVRAERPDEITVLYRYLPLPIHPYGRASALAANCAARQGAFEAMHDQLFAAQDSFGKRSWVWFAQRAKIADTVAFRRCTTDSASFAPVLTTDSISAELLAVRGTPTFLVNDLEIVGSPGKKLLANYVASALAKNRGHR